MNQIIELVDQQHFSREMKQGNPPGKPYRKTHPFFNTFVHAKSFVFLASRQRFLIVLTCSSIFWPKNDAERSRNYLKKQVLEPNCAVW